MNVMNFNGSGMPYLQFFDVSGTVEIFFDNNITHGAIASAVSVNATIV